MMTSRERVLTALNHQEPDRVPIDLGGTAVSSIAIPTCAALRKHLGLPDRPIETLEIAQQLAVVDDDVLDLFGGDVIPISANPPDGYAAVMVDEPDGGRSFKDEFGATLRWPPGGGFVFSPVHNIQPLVPPENVVALFAAAREFGRYPIATD